MTKRRKKTDYPDYFETFWLASPMTGKKSRAFAAHGDQVEVGETQESLLAYMKRWMTHPDLKRKLALRAAGQEHHIMHVSTWLNGRDFENENNLGPAPTPIGETMGRKRADEVCRLLDSVLGDHDQKGWAHEILASSQKAFCVLWHVRDGKYVACGELSWDWPTTLELGIMEGLTDDPGSVVPITKLLACHAASLTSMLAGWRREAGETG